MHNFKIEHASSEKRPCRISWEARVSEPNFRIEGPCDMWSVPLAYGTSLNSDLRGRFLGLQCLKKPYGQTAIVVGCPMYPIVVVALAKVDMV
ncbi:unnamed protein product [Sphenostylis stenocarpa]|uniref:Uncharacterized protein n=1 Tax=Sphenostylis stenocarpa TaxID=92480 RepID=A0AA86RZP6_9FABA|nr:unnamed protein product [Sphenostylis stenocarpa]